MEIIEYLLGRWPYRFDGDGLNGVFAFRRGAFGDAEFRHTHHRSHESAQPKRTTFGGFQRCQIEI